MLGRRQREREGPPEPHCRCCLLSVGAASSIPEQTPPRSARAAARAAGDPCAMPCLQTPWWAREEPALLRVLAAAVVSVCTSVRSGSGEWSAAIPGNLAAF